MYICMCVRIYMCMYYVPMFACVFKYVCILLYLYACMKVCVCACMYKGSMGFILDS